MFTPNSYEGIDAYAADLIRSKARLMVGKAGLTESDRPDLEQELMIDLLSRMKHFNPSKGKKNTFMARIVERRIVSLLESRFAQRRDCRLCRNSLNEPAPGDRSFERGDLVSGDSINEHVSREPRERRIEDLRIDLEIVIASLPEDLRDLCERLKDDNMQQIARDLGMCRSTLYGRLYRLREVLIEAGMKEYL